MVKAGTFTFVAWGLPYPTSLVGGSAPSIAVDASTFCGVGKRECRALLVGVRGLLSGEFELSSEGLSQ